MIDLTKFNPQQQQAITSTNPYIKVIAGAGSGKTAVLTNRIANLVLERNVDPRKILAITFTNKAAKEMKSRVLDILEQDYFPGVITTFHSFCLRVLREDINLLGYTKDFNIIDSEDQKQVLKEINKKLKYDKDYFKVKSVLAFITNKKNDYHPYESDTNLLVMYEQFYKEYQDYLKINNSVDFDDLILLCVKLFAENPIILEKWRYRYNYIHVDEFQDTNAQQYQLIKLLGQELNVFVVGDPDQTIYTWRGAKTEYILDFEKDFENAEVIKLEYNYRSKKHILDIANSLIVNNTQRIDKDLVATIDSDEKVIHFIGETGDDEANYVVDKIEEIISEVDGINYDDFAILYRSNYVSRVFEQFLTKYNINYKIIGGTRFFERKEIKDIIAYLKVINNNDEIAMQRIINVPKRKMGPKAIDKVSDYANKNNISSYEALSKHLLDIKLSNVQTKAMEDFVLFIEMLKNSNESVDHMIEAIIQKYELLEEYSKNSIDYLKRESNVEELLSFAKGVPSELNTFLQDSVLETGEDEADNQPAVSLMSMHGAKGLEFKYVFAVYLNDGIFPSAYSLESLNLEEERRLAYVCFTRAKEQLFLLSHSKKDFYTTVSSSMFIKEIEEELLDKEGRYRQDYYLQPEVNEVNTFFAQKNDDGDISINDVVSHPIFKKGVVINKVDNVLTIAFENKIGIKQIAENFVEKI
ncbi:MAG: UvrD-helicase domain-containing protein [Erysipelotrichales bacterium]